MYKIILAFLIMSSAFSKNEPIFPFKKDLFRNNIANEFLENQVKYIRNRFYTILSFNIIPGKNDTSRKPVLRLLKQLDKRTHTQQYLLSKCSFSYSKKCRKEFKHFIDLIKEDIELTGKSIKKEKIGYVKNLFSKYRDNLIEQYFHFNKTYASINLGLGKVKPDHLYSTHKFLRNSIFESFDYFMTLANKKSSGRFVTFFHRFIIPSHHITATRSNHKNITYSFEHLSKTLYDFSFYMDKFGKISRKTQTSARSMMNHWNQVHKFFTRR